MAYIQQCTSQHPEEVRVKIAGLDTNYIGNDRTYIWYYDGTQVTLGSLSLGARVSESPEWTQFGGYTQGQSVYVEARIYYNNGANYVDLAQVCTAGWGYGGARPSYFYWTYPKTSGGTFNLTAAEWNSLCANINQVRLYKGVTWTYPFTTAVTGNDFTANIYNQAVSGIKGISGYGAYLSYHNSGDIIYASDMNLLVSEINAVP